MELLIPAPDLRALVEGETIVAFVARATVGPGDEIELSASGDRPPEELKPAYRRWAGEAVPGGPWTAEVVALHPAAGLDERAGDARHVLHPDAVPGGDIVVLRVFGPDGPVLSDREFAGQLDSLEDAIV